ncbi:MAG: hypothetical protein AUH14_08120, partial [Candidatus Rokubacteria bacterium 13_2_20CM_69_15_1]
RLDAKLVALDAKTGKELWTATVVDYKAGHAITSPPLVYKNLVVTGFAGGEFGVRGAVQAYKQDTGDLVWKTHTIPGPGEPGNETWMGDSWKTGAGSTWYVGSYDPKLNLVYWGTSNAGPWGAHTRSTDTSEYGQYRNLHTASQVAFDADTGRIAWTYQMTPADVWDYDGVNEAVLADLRVGGQTVPALMKADRNGFFYVLDRETGKLVSAEPFVEVNWAKRIDKATGRPIEDPEKRPRLNRWARNVCPNLFGGKNWEPMSYSRQTGLVYIPSFNLCMDIAGKTEDYTPGKFYLASEFDLDKAGTGGHLSELKAWDPVKQTAAWGIKEDLPFLGGAMSTAGGLVFYGNTHGVLKGVDAKTGDVLWKFNVGTGILQSPMTYAVDGKQYLAVVAGRGAACSWCSSSVADRTPGANSLADDGGAGRVGLAPPFFGQRRVRRGLLRFLRGDTPGGGAVGANREPGGGRRRRDRRGPEPVQPILRALPRAKRGPGRAAARPAPADAPLRAAGARRVLRGDEQGAPRQGDARLEGRPERRGAAAHSELPADRPDRALSQADLPQRPSRSNASAKRR